MSRESLPLAACRSTIRRPIHTPMEHDVPPKLPPHVVRVRNSTGRVYHYLHRHRGTARAERPIRLPDDPRDLEFWAEYARLMSLPKPAVKTDTVAALIAAWHQSPEWAALSDKTAVEWTRACKRISQAWGDLEVRGIEPRHVLALRDAWAATPATANNILRCLSSMLGWSVPRGWRPDNPCREVRKLRGRKDYAPWPWDVIEAVRAELEPGHPEMWWAIALALYTGQRLGDCLGMRWSAISRDGTAISLVQDKTDKALVIPLHRDLRLVLDRMPRRATTVLTTAGGRPWRAFQASWRRARPAVLRERGLVFHGLRKSAVVMLLEAGCTEAETASITGQSLQMVAHYARQVNQAKLARAAILKWEGAR